MSNARWGGIVLGTFLCAAVIAGSRVPWDPEPPQAAVVRLSWRAVPAMVEECHPPTEEELAGLPPHMRPPEICVGRAIPFRLRFRLDGETLVDEQVLGAGVREGRPMYVFHEARTVAGEHVIEVDWVPDGQGADEGASATAAGIEGATLREVVTLQPLDIALVTWGEDGGLVLR